MKNWDMAITSSTKVKIPELADQPNTLFAGKALSSLTIIPLESGNTTFDITLNYKDHTIKTSLSRPILSDLRLVVDMPEKNQITV